MNAQNTQNRQKYLKCLLKKTDSIIQLALSNLLCLLVGCFWQYFVPMSKALHANLTSFFKFNCYFIEY